MSTHSNTACDEVVIVKIGSRRYVVDAEDIHLFDHIPSGPVRFNLRFTYFGGQWLRGLGRVDECCRALSMDDVTRVGREKRTKVYG